MVEVATSLEHEGVVYEVGQTFDVGNGGRIKIVGVGPKELQVEYVIPMRVLPDYLAKRGKLVT